jgi:hypothetical protein
VGILKKKSKYFPQILQKNLKKYNKNTITNKKTAEQTPTPQNTILVQKQVINNILVEYIS